MINRISGFILSGLMSAVVMSATVQEQPPGYAVVSANPLATNAGLEILAKGGNAFDAAIAVASTLAVVEPYHTGLGGGGFWLLHTASDNSNIMIDSREKAPHAAHKNMFLDDKGEVVAGLSLDGGLAAGIPGQPAALVYIAEHYGRLPLSESLAPAIRLAEEGFAVDQHFNYYSSMVDRLKQMQRFPATAKTFLNNGQPYKTGERLIQADLAHTLRILAKEGHAGFYQGKIAKQLVDGVRGAGGVWTLEDLATYQIKIRKPLEGNYHSLHITTVAPPSAGGVTLLTALNILANYSLADLSKVQQVHYIIEAMRLAYWQSNQLLADPDYVKIDLDLLLSAENAKTLNSKILPDRAIPSDTLPGQQPQNQHNNTSHLSILDREGNRVAATLTVNFIFGSSVVAEGTGVLMNDEMDDFSTKPGVRNVFGIVGSVANEIAPGKRPLSNMTPTFIDTPERVAILGTPGGSRIPSMVLLSTLLFDNYAGAISMVSAMRFHHQYLPDWIQFEPDSFSPALQDELKTMGYQLMALKQYYGDMQAISWDKKIPLITAASDPRGIGLGAVVTTNVEGYGVNH